MFLQCVVSAHQLLAGAFQAFAWPYQIVIVLHHQRSLHVSHTANMQTSLPYLTGGVFQHRKNVNAYTYLPICLLTNTTKGGGCVTSAQSMKPQNVKMHISG